ncbi:MAG: antitoxin [Micrococcales bacterium]|nr:antitoxin [Micrococcales bacterium]
MVRTTITLDTDVAALVKQRMTERGASFKATVNDALREALGGMERVDFSFPVHDLGEARVDVQHALRLAADLEDEEIAREMSLGR